MVGHGGLEPPTSVLSGLRSKPTELMAPKRPARGLRTGRALRALPAEERQEKLRETVARIGSERA